MFFAKLIVCFLFILLLNDCFESHDFQKNVSSKVEEIQRLPQNYHKYITQLSEKPILEFGSQNVFFNSKKLKIWAKTQYKKFKCFSVDFSSFLRICHILAKIISSEVVYDYDIRQLLGSLPNNYSLIKPLDQSLEGYKKRVLNIWQSTDYNNKSDVQTNKRVVYKPTDRQMEGITSTLDEKYVNQYMTAKTDDEIKVLNFLRRHNREASHQCYYTVVSEWNYATNITQENRHKLLKATQKFNDFQRRQSIEALKYNWTQFDKHTQRQLKKIAFIGTAVLEGSDGLMFTQVLNEMQTIFSTARVCVADKCSLQLDPHLSEIMATSDNYSQLLEVWVKWRDASGKQMRDKFITYINLGNKAAQMINLPNQKFETLLDLWLFQWETPHIRQQMKKLLKQLLPFYEKLHAFVRIKLNDALPGKMPKDNTIPAHLLGNMWAQQWTHVMKSVEGVDPYPQIQTIDVTQALRDKNYSPRKMFESAETFLTDLGLDPMTHKFWQNSIFEKPKDRDIVCHASAWDFFTGDDFRIKQCSQVNMESFIKAHHEMGHIQYYMQYKDQPMPFREGANPGFHEAIGDLLSLSVSTPKHLNKLGLFEFNESIDTNKVNLKFQMRMALNDVVLLPFAYIIDKWRSDVFSGKVSSANMNRHWWYLRGHYQGISPPVIRSEEDFDPGAKYHIANSVEYMRYFVSHILQFQLHRAVCDLTQRDVPLYECDIGGNKRTGNKLRQFLEEGSSEEWPQLLERLTGDKELSVEPLLEYFKPLQDFLDHQLKGEEIGWNYSVDDYFDSSKTSNL